MNDLGKIKRDVLSEIEREVKFTQITLESTLSDNTLDYKEKILKVKKLIQILADSDIMVNATNNIFIDNSQAPNNEETTNSSEEASTNVADGLNQLHNE